MAFITTYTFRAEIAKAALIDFIARTPHDRFFFLVLPGGEVYGHFIGEELIEFFTNEFPVRTLAMIPAGNLRSQLSTEGARLWGNAELQISL